MNSLSRLLARFTFLRWMALLALMMGVASPALATKTYIHNADGSTSDPTTGLTWSHCTWGTIGTECSYGTPVLLTWADALDLTNQLNIFQQDSYRVPNIRELQSIVDRSSEVPAIDPTAFPNLIAANFWSSTTVASDSAKAWIVNFFGGSIDLNPKSFSRRTLFVRGGRPLGLLDIARPSTDYVDQGNGTVLHTPTNLVWQRCAVGQTWTGSTCGGEASILTWDEATQLTSTLAGQNDWRLPTEEELLSLVDYSRHSPAINAEQFPNTSMWFWSASAYAGNTSDYAWIVDFLDGGALPDRKVEPSHVRLVRTKPSFDTFAITINKTGTGTVTSNPAGINCGSLCTAFFTSGTRVVLSATADSGSTFTGWSGTGCSGTGSCVVSMSQAQSVTASFTRIQVGVTTISIQVVVDYNSELVITPAGFYWHNIGGTKPGFYGNNYQIAGPIYVNGIAWIPTWDTSGSRDAGVSTLYAVDIVGYTGWSLSSHNDGYFDSYPQDWGATTFLTSVSDPLQINRGTLETSSYDGHPTVHIMDYGNGQNVYSFDLNIATSYSLSVSRDGPGTGSVTSNPVGIDCGATCSASYTNGTSVTLTATADAGSTFGGWSGACSGNGTCTVSMNAAQSVTATFTANSYTLSVSKAGTGTGVVSSPAGSGLYCGTVCSVAYPSGTSVTLTAMAITGSTFSGWSGAGCSGMGTCTVLMNQAQSVTASFALATASTVSPYDGIYQWDPGYYLSVHQIGGGILIGTIYWVYTANPEQVGTRAVSEADTFDLSHGQLVGSTATMTGTRFYRGCTLEYDFTFNSDSSLTVRFNSVSNSPGVSAADVDCAARYNPVGSVWTIPRIY